MASEEPQDKGKGQERRNCGLTQTATAFGNKTIFVAARSISSRLGKRPVVKSATIGRYFISPLPRTALLGTATCLSQPATWSPRTIAQRYGDGSGGGDFAPDTSIAVEEITTVPATFAKGAVHRTFRPLE